jgi:hypothetical protein
MVDALIIRIIQSSEPVINSLKWGESIIRFDSQVHSWLVIVDIVI